MDRWIDRERGKRERERGEKREGGREQQSPIGMHAYTGLFRDGGCTTKYDIAQNGAMSCVTICDTMVAYNKNG